MLARVAAYGRVGNKKPRRSEAEERRLCKFYFERQYGHDYSGGCVSGTTAFMAMTFSEKRAEPFIDAPALATAKVRNQSSAVASPLVTSLVFFDVHETGNALVQASVSSGLYTGDFAMLQLNSDYIDIDARL
mgnify:FL=1